MARLLESVLPKAAAQFLTRPAPLIQVSHVRHEDLTRADIPTEWIVSGTPQARVKHLQVSPDEKLAIALWDCTEGSFNWYFAGDEFVHILEGEVTVRDGDGSTHVLRPGDIAYFPAGLTSLWRVHGYVKKLAVYRQEPPSLALRAWRKAKRILRPQAAP